MKIAIISINMYSKGLNFACPLHNYAFQQFLLKNGIENEILNYTPIYFNNFDMRHPSIYYARISDNYKDSGRADENPTEYNRLTSLQEKWSELYEERERRYDKFQHFIDTNYRKTKQVYDSDLLEFLDPGFDCYICCTDVIWKKEPNFGFDRGFFLASTTMENKWKISYAASRGMFFSENSEDENWFLQSVNDIDAVSVREESLKNYLSEHLEKEITQVLDPVLLHEKEFYDSILVKPKEEHYLFLYYVMEKANDTVLQAVSYARAHHLKIVEITDLPLKRGKLSEYNDIDVTYRYDMGIEEWLGYIRYADCVFTNSFHACCFSILFEKQLFVGKRDGDKVTNILNIFGLTDRRFTIDSDLITNPLPDIDYSKVTPILRQKRQESADFILSNIHRMEQTPHPVRSYEAQKRSISYQLCYFLKSGDFLSSPEFSSDSMETRTDGSLLYRVTNPVTNNETSVFLNCMFQKTGYTFDCWKIRFRIDHMWFWYLEDGTFVPINKYDISIHPAIKTFSAGDAIPYIPVHHISYLFVEPCWNEYTLLYNSCCTISSDHCQFDPTQFGIYRTARGNTECRFNQLVSVHSQTVPLYHGFSRPGYQLCGWNICLKSNKKWFYYLADGSLKQQSDYRKESDTEKYLLKKGEQLPHFSSFQPQSIRLEAVWEMNFSTKVKRKLKEVFKIS